MKIDPTSSTLEAALLPDLNRLVRSQEDEGYSVFSHRHAADVHVLGISREVHVSASEFPLLILRVAISSLGSESIKGEVLWFRSRSDLGVSDDSVTVSGISKSSVAEFQESWPELIRAFKSARERNFPKKPNQAPEQTRTSVRSVVQSRWPRGLA